MDLPRITRCACIDFYGTQFLFVRDSSNSQNKNKSTRRRLYLSTHSRMWVNIVIVSLLFFVFFYSMIKDQTLEL